MVKTAAAIHNLNFTLAEKDAFEDHQRQRFDKNGRKERKESDRAA
jgi:hypothetical protein